MPRALKRLTEAMRGYMGMELAYPVLDFLLTFRAQRPMAQEKNAILAEKATALTASTMRGRGISPRWLAAAAVVPLLGVVAAFGIAPSTSTDTVVLQRVLQDVPSGHPRRPTKPRPEYFARRTHSTRRHARLVARASADRRRPGRELSAQRTTRALACISWCRAARCGRSPRTKVSCLRCAISTAMAPSCSCSGAARISSHANNRWSPSSDC